ncbi:MAG: hypothetical protein K5893_02500 [Prevotella sp.]|nr:hypothetical protein [Prevotella sp.]
MSHRRIVLLFMLLSALGVSHAQDRQQLRDSLRTMSRQLETNPGDVELRLRKAALNMQLDEWDYARLEYDKIIAHEPYNIAALFYRAYANERLRRHAFARTDYETLLTIVPAHFEARLGLALLNQKDKRYTEAMDQLNILIQQHPDSALAYAARAGAEAERNYTELAIFDYSEAIRLQPTNTEYLVARADLYIKERQFAEARKDLDRLIALGIPRKSLEDLFLRLKK